MTRHAVTQFHQLARTDLGRRRARGLRRAKGEANAQSGKEGGREGGREGGC